MIWNGISPPGISTTGRSGGCGPTTRPTETDSTSCSAATTPAGRTLLRAQDTARQQSLDHRSWNSIAEIAPSVSGWRYRETLGYVTKIEANLTGLKSIEEAPVEKPPVEDTAESRH